MGPSARSSGGSRSTKPGPEMERGKQRQDAGNARGDRRDGPQNQISKLVATAADKRILFFERDQMSLGENQIYDEIAKLAPDFPDLRRVDEIWFVNTSLHQSEGWVYFRARRCPRHGGADFIPERCSEKPA
jgi:hypothetical protein